MWCHVRLINPTKSHPERINKQDKKNAANLNSPGMKIRSTLYIFQKSLTLKLLIYY